VDIPTEYIEKARKYRARMIEAAAEHDDALMEAFVNDEPAGEQAIRRGIRKGTLANKLHPVFVGSALKYIGVQRLLDGVVAYLPAPLDKPVIKDAFDLFFLTERQPAPF